MRETMTFCLPCLFGVEGIAAQELRDLELANVRAENGRVLFDGGWGAEVLGSLYRRVGGGGLRRRHPGLYPGAAPVV